MNEYKEFLKHLGIKPSLMLADMISRLPDSKKPVFISRRKEKETFRDEANFGYNKTNE